MQSTLDPLAGARNILLTTYKRDGTAIATPVHVAVDGDRAYVRTYGKAFKWRRVRNHPDCVVAPCTTRGRVTGDELSVRGRVLAAGGEDAHAAARALGRKYPVLHGLLFPRLHRLMRTPTVHIEFVAGPGSRGVG